MANELAHQVVTGHRHQVALAHIPHLLQHLGHAHCDRGLAGSGVASKAHVQGRGLGLQALLRAQFVNQQQSRYVANAPFNGCQPDQLRVELVKHRPHARCFKERSGRHRSRRGCVCGGSGKRGCIHGDFWVWFCIEPVAFRALPSIARAFGHPLHRVALNSVADSAPRLFAAHQPEAGLVFGSVHDERHHH